MPWKNLIKEGAKAMAIDIDTLQIDQFAVHAAELIKWNQKTNLTAITNPKAIAIKHFLDSIAAARMIPAGAAILDIGSGGGFPGIPLKVVKPSLAVTLVDAVRKKVSFLKHIIRTLALKNIEAHQIRAEALDKNRGFDVVIARAFSNLSEFVSLALPLLAEDGVMIALKGVVAETEAEISYLVSKDNRLKSTPAVDTLSITTTTYTLPYLESQRTIVTLKKQP